MVSRFAQSITVRPAYADDALALRRLAALDSAKLPAQPLLVAEVEGELRAALSLVDGSAIADPFHPTTALLELLRTHAASVAPRPRSRRRTSARPAGRVLARAA